MDFVSGVTASQEVFCFFVVVFSCLENFEFKSQIERVFCEYN
jgi:hypothetical protein